MAPQALARLRRIASAGEGTDAPFAVDGDWQSSAWERAATGAVVTASGYLSENLPLDTSTFLPYKTSVYEVSRYSGPIVRWDPPPAGNWVPVTGSALVGAAVGFVVAAIFALSGLGLLALVSGTASGAAFRPVATKARTGQAWVGIVISIA